jgi:hypothetical protein
VLGQQAATAYAISSVASKLEDMDAPVFNMPIDCSPVHLQQPGCVWDSQKSMKIFAERAPDLPTRKPTGRAPRRTRRWEKGGHNVPGKFCPAYVEGLHACESHVSKTLSNGGSLCLVAEPVNEK